jgi:hypothetical protein
VVGVYGRIPIPPGDWKEVTITTKVTAPADMTVRLLVGSKNDFEVNVGTTTVKGKGSGTAVAPDQSSVEIKLLKGDNLLRFTTKTSGKGNGAYLRFHDPDRKLRYPEN